MSATPFHLDSACLPLDRLAAFERNILDGIQDLLLVLAPDGRVLHASQMCLALTSLTPEHFVGNHIATFMHYDDLPVFLEEFKASSLSGQPWRFQHRLRKADDTFAVFESAFSPFLDTSAAQTAGFHGLHKCVMTVRPYSHPSAVLLDSYLEHITTQARLIQQLEDLRSEAEILEDDDDDEDKVILNSAMDNDRALSDRAVSKLQRTSGAGDIGIQITVSRLETIRKTGSWAAKPCVAKRRKNAKPCDHICVQCGTKDSPEWRTGSRGKKTLCNACGQCVSQP
ncbi:hypothetical protein M436DRAFT_76924 [Aureobasidium namibiae CBS 147.97]|uniref:GATA-type domain-containing protein n=1 Tax=Aureobasidium namibiae CBS 147.97 TaxID=1043004 RepID=A0A074W9W8_9PEZI|nr:uncharacterized protein M436DRAFT_76924 [Aureobasidium namibiae CBS 147.97]KEQ68409.1 hypothetical protein M436DRAFT_76924 [Aureobasidium namibiae CBS 147.97]